MTIEQDQKSRRADLLDGARRTAEKAAAAGRDLTISESTSIDAAISAARAITAEIEARREAEAKSKSVFDSLDAMARNAAGSDSSSRLALTGKNAKILADRIIAGMGEKAFPAAGVQITSNILLSGIAETGKPVQSILDALPSRVVPPTYSYLRQLPGTAGRDLKAAIVPAGSEKPVSTVGLETVQGHLRTLATLSSPVHNFALKDNANLEQFVISELIYGIRVALEQQVLNGDGAGENLTGLLGTSGILSQAFSSDVTTTIRKAITTLQSTGYQPAFAVISAASWEACDLAANAAAGAVDYRGLPTGTQAQRLFDVPIVISNVLPAKTGLLIGEGAATVDTDGRLDIAWSDGDGGFKTNTLTARVETRVGLSVTQPAAVVKLATSA
jgi:HK97 family phage major capsid protein